ncbi:MAG: hypothetical protein M3Y48_05070 [Actinomycetota bacterium]|nr:hypothetical protein [Actinomycetota bacterium]
MRSPELADHAGLLVMFGSDAAVAEHVGVPVRGGPRRPPDLHRGPPPAPLSAAHIIEQLRALLAAIGEEDR